MKPRAWSGGLRPFEVFVGLLCVRRAWSQVAGGTRVLRPTLAGGHCVPPPWPHQHRVCHALARATANGACARGHHRRPAGISGGLPPRSPRCLWGRWFGCAIAGPIRGRPGGCSPQAVLTRQHAEVLTGRPRAWAGERIPGSPARAPIVADLRQRRQRAAGSHWPVIDHRCSGKLHFSHRRPRPPPPPPGRGRCRHRRSTRRRSRPCRPRAAAGRQRPGVRPSPANACSRSLRGRDR